MAVYLFNPKACEGCGGKYCKGEGYVFVSKEEIERIASYLGIEFDRFRRLYVGVEPYSGRDVLASITYKGCRRCVFLGDDDRCEIYPVRPHQCRSFPFWRSLKGKDEKELIGICRGIEIVKRFRLTEDKG